MFTLSFSRVFRLSILSALLAVGSSLIAAPVFATEPAAFDTWQNLEPSGGWIGEIVVSSADRGMRYALGSSGAVYRWLPDADAWERRGALPYSTDTMLSIDSTNPSTLWAAAVAGDGVGPAWIGTSTDGGQTWGEESIPGLDLRDRIAEIVVQADRVLLAASFSGLWRRDDGAWTRLFEGGIASDLAADPDDPDRLFASLGGDLFRSLDGGTTWETVLAGDAFEIFVAGEGSRAVYSVFFDGTSPIRQGLHRSFDDGDTWETIEGPVPSGLSPHDPAQLWALESDRVLRSPDRGTTWSPVELDLDFNLRPHGIAFGNPGQVVVTGGLGAWSSEDDGESWSETNRGLFEQSVVALEIDPIDPSGFWALTQGSELYRSDDGGASWRRVFVFPVGTTAPFLFEVIASEPRTLLFTPRGRAGWWQSFDGGATWETVLDSVDGEPPAVIYDLVSDFSPDPDDPSRILAAGWRGTNSLLLEARIWSTENGGRTWTLIDSRTEPRAFRKIRRDPFDPELFYLAGENLVRWRSNLLSVALGEFFSGEATHRIDAVAVDPATRGRLWVVAQRGPNSTSAPQPFGLLRSDDRGVTWTKVTDRFDDGEVTDLLVAPNDSDRLFAVVDARAWTSGDAGRTWQALAENGTPIQDLAIDPRFPSTLVSAGFGSGVQRFVFTNGAGCDAAPVLCLGDGFYAEVSWRDFDDATGIGRSVPLAASGPSDTGAFWFFDSANLELVVKVLDGRAINGAYWVFYGSLSNVEYDLRVTAPDGRVAAYRNSLGTFASTGDTSAFPEP